MPRSLSRSKTRAGSPTRSHPARALCALLLAGALALSCGDPSTSTRADPSTDSSVSIALKVGQSVAADIASAEIVVTAADIGEIRQALTIDGTSISGTVSGIPAGNQRTFTFNGYDINDKLIFNGSTQVDMAAGEVVPVHIAVRRVAAGTASGKIAFFSDRDGNTEIYIMDGDGSNQTRLTNSPSDDNWPTWSPDGTQIAFGSDRDGNFEIYIMDRDGTNLRNLTNHPADEVSPAWSPDGTQIAFGSNRDGNFEIYVADVNDGDKVTRLTVNPADDNGPSWSPDGAKIAFFSFRTDNWEVFLMDSDGSEPVNLTNSGHGEWTRQAPWAPDGSRLALTFDPIDATLEPDIFTIAASGGDFVQLTFDEAADSDPAWSPDGANILFSTDRDGNFEIYRMDATGTNQVNLTNSAGTDLGAMWSPNSR